MLVIISNLLLLRKSWRENIKETKYLEQKTQITETLSQYKNNDFISIINKFKKEYTFINNLK